MTERPILYSAAMVRAILEGRKRQTRRVIPERVLNRLVLDNHPSFRLDAISICPYGRAGDRLWVREACMFSIDAPAGAVRYRADDHVRPGLGDFELERWRPSIHMPRWASRIDLEITGVRVEQLQDISESDAMAEGIRHLGPGYERWHPDPADTEFTGTTQDPRLSFRGLWESINGAGSWGANPWVWVIDFTEVQP